MSLENESNKKVTKRQRARELAAKYKGMEYTEARGKIMEEIPCSRSTATKALKWFEAQQAEEAEVAPSLKVVKEEKKEPPFLEPTEEKPIEEIEAKPIEALKAEEVEEQLDLFRDMLRGLHVLILADGGVIDLLTKAGRPEKQVKQVSDQLYRWLLRRYSAEDLEKFDTILLIASYGTLIGAILTEVLKKRKKEEKKKP